MKELPTKADHDSEEFRFVHIPSWNLGTRVRYSANMQTIGIICYNKVCSSALFDSTTEMKLSALPNLQI